MCSVDANDHIWGSSNTISDRCSSIRVLFDLSNLTPDGPVLVKGSYCVACKGCGMQGVWHVLRGVACIKGCGTLSQSTGQENRNGLRTSSCKAARD